jgi:hypothetical protein
MYTYNLNNFKSLFLISLSLWQIHPKKFWSNFFVKDPACFSFIYFHYGYAVFFTCQS